ncbi:group-specific protein [Bacillus sp. AFS040349]|uniref:group-specific protein n=1 Tax=Bacillus sp. AFS040349 TaxID=2033502 RepID=UPI000BFBF36F|nr:group-specific protein [Bacillus sp. AFS040349]PGT91576.1 group-specific protein [Bacillus sp. AFS040349]
MSSCKIDHTIDDVTKKLNEQTPYMDTSLVEKCFNFLSTSVTQTDLNELFHLLKKYDLASEDEKKTRMNKIEKLVQ